MTTRAGFVGILTGLITVMVLVYPLAIARYATSIYWISAVLAVLVTVGGGLLAGRWSGSVRPVRCALLGGLAGGLAGVIVFCLLGAASAGLTVFAPTRVECIAMMMRQTQGTFLSLFLGGIVLGSLGGWLSSPRQDGREELFDKSEPQMAMNAAITAVPASIVAGALSAFVFSRLADSIGKSSILDMPLTVSLLLVLLSHLALTLVVPHEAQQAEHACGMDEVKMAAFVGIAAAPVLALLLFLVDARLLLKPQVIVALLAGMAMSLRSLQVLSKIVMPRRASLLAPLADRQKIEATWFGTIADSHGTRLVVLCIGCGLVMILPLYVTVISVLINLTICLGQSAPAKLAQTLFLTQALASSGIVAAAILLLIAIYLFYLNLGRWFKRRPSS
jgi:hypothetical protein